MTKWYSVPLCLVVLAIAASTANAEIRNARTGYTYTSMQLAVNAAVSGDTIEIDGTYTGSAVFASINKNLTIRGVGESRAVLDANYTCPNNQGIFILSGSSNVTVENIEFRNCRGASGGNGCGIRIVGRNVTIRNCYFYNNENGIMGNPSTSSGSSVLVEHSEFNYNGWGDLGQTHNIYVGTFETFTMRYSWSHNAHIGHEVKSRARTNYILYNRIGNETPNPDGRNASYEINIPQAGLTYIIGNQIHQSPYTDNGGIISYAEENWNNPDHRLFVINNTIFNQRGSGTFIRNASATPAWVQNNIFQGGGTILNGPGTELNNWVTNNARFVNAGAYDYHLTAFSTGAIDQGGVPNPSPMPPFSLIADCQYVHPLSYEPRPIRGTIDIGAYEYAPNTAPTVNAGADQTVVEGQVVQLHATASDPDSDPLIYTWIQQAGPTVALAGAASADASFTAPAINTLDDTTLTFTVTVSDGRGGLASDSVNVRICMLTDTNQDDAVDVVDLLTLVEAFGSGQDDPNYDPTCDFNSDGYVDVVDLLYLVDDFGRTLE